MKADESPIDDKESIIFGTNNVNIDAASVTATDEYGNKWTITTKGTTSFTKNEAYYQVGSSKSPATSITFECTLPNVATITSCSIKLGGFSGTAGVVSIKLGETSVEDKLNAANDVTVKSNTPAACEKITISITGIAKGVKVYWIDYKYATSDSEIAKANINSSNTKAQLKYSFGVTQGESVSSFVKVTTEPSDWSGEYLIVNEAGSVAFDGSLTKLDVASNTQAVEKITEEQAHNYSFIISKISDEEYSIRSSSGYYIGQTSNANGLKSSTSTAYANKISCNADGTIDIISSGAYLRYNAASDQKRFRYYKSGQKAICLYKLTKVTEKIYTFSNMKMNLGAVIEAAKVKALVDAGLSISSYGVAVAQKAKLGESSINYVVTNNNSFDGIVSIVSKQFEGVDAMQKTDVNGTAKTGDYVIFNADLSFPDKSKYNVGVSAVAFFKLGDGTYVFFQERTLSVASLAQEYINKTDVYNTFDPNVQGSLKALAATPASVA